MTSAKPPCLIFEDTYAIDGKGMVFAHPAKIFSADQPSDVADVFTHANKLLAEGYWLAGWISYETGYVLEPHLQKLCPEQRDWPLVWFGAFRSPTKMSALEREDFWQAQSLGPRPRVPVAEKAWSEAAYGHKFDRVRNYLLAGDVYQVNLTFPVTLPGLLHDRRLHALLRRIQPSPYSAWVETEHGTLSSLSPELFVRKAGNRLTTRPMKGTAPRPLDTESSAASEALKQDEKTRAENLMIVDLLRNDLSRIAVPGTVSVPTLFEVETYADVLQVTSTVACDIRADVDLAGMMKALFPCGSVTGAPKIRAMEIIRDLEEVPRNIYTGALGWISPDKDFQFSVAIRTLATASNGISVYGTGSGVVADSKPKEEYAEALHKARPVTHPAPTGDLLETFLWTKQTGCWLLQRHLQRMARSAGILGYAFDEARCRSTLEEITKQLDPAHSWRVRVLSSRLGFLSVMASQLAKPVTPCLKATPTASITGDVTIYGVTLDPSDRRLRHKTTERALYETAWRTSNPDGRYLDILLVNQDGHLVDGCRNTVLLWDGESLVTPGLEAGALPGVVREALVDEGLARVAGTLLTLQDVANATAIFLANGVYGLRRVNLVSTPESHHH